MRLENGFDVAAPRDAAWRLLNDVPRVLPCMPGAELDEIVSDDAWKVKLRVKLGPISLQFLGDVTREQLDEAAGRVALAVKAREAKGRGSADASIESTVSSLDAGTRVDIVTELTLRGAVAQYGRGIVADVAAALTQQFADCLAGKLAESTSAAEDAAAPAEPPPAEAAPPRQVDGLRLLLRALLRRFRR